jgi:GNAT superfamily N-acetyltransferase
MSLPILPTHPTASAEDLVRFYYRTELQWIRQMAEESPLEAGSAFTNPNLANVGEANLMFDASIAEGATAADAVAEVDQHFRAQKLTCLKWVLNPAVPRERTKPLEEHLEGLGYTRRSRDILYLGGPPLSPVREVGGLNIIPARASFRHARELIAESVANDVQRVEAGMLHLEDPQTDALIALKDGAAVALVSVLTVGEIGCIEGLFVAERFRSQGIGRTMLSRGMEICARSLFKHVFSALDGGDPRASSLYSQLGFHKVGEFVSHVAPSA